MSRKTTVEEIIALMNRSAAQLRERKIEWTTKGEFSQAHRCQDKMTELNYILGRITANENDIRSITESGD